jgi:hypothetical protein
MDDPAERDALRQLLDKQAIYEVSVRYCRGIDRLDFELVRSCYHPDAREHHPGFEGGRDDYVAWVSAGLPGMDGTLHVIANHLAEIDGDRARAETYVNAYHWKAPYDDPGSNFSTGSRYVDTMERRDGEWRILERWCVRDWMRIEVGSGELRVADDENRWPRPQRDRSDVVYGPLR